MRTLLESQLWEQPWLLGTVEKNLFWGQGWLVGTVLDNQFWGQAWLLGTVEKDQFWGQGWLMGTLLDNQFWGQGLRLGSVEENQVCFFSLCSPAASQPRLPEAQEGQELLGAGTQGQGRWRRWSGCGGPGAASQQRHQEAEALLGQNPRAGGHHSQRWAFLEGGQLLLP